MNIYAVSLVLKHEDKIKNHLSCWQSCSEAEARGFAIERSFTLLPNAALLSHAVLEIKQDSQENNA